jgi:signal transduction histidine kinase
MDVADLTLEGLVHDLNNVFQTIGESAELLDRDPKWQKLAHTLQRSVDRGQRIVHSILESNRTGANSLRLSKMRLSFAAIIWSAPTARKSSSGEIDPDFRLKG